MKARMRCRTEGDKMGAVHLFNWAARSGFLRGAGAPPLPRGSLVHNGLPSWDASQGAPQEGVQGTFSPPRKGNPGRPTGNALLKRKALSSTFLCSSFILCHLSLYAWISQCVFISRPDQSIYIFLQSPSRNPFNYSIFYAYTVYILCMKEKLVGNVPLSYKLFLEIISGNILFMNLNLWQQF